MLLIIPFLLLHVPLIFYHRWQMDVKNVYPSHPMSAAIGVLLALCCTAAEYFNNPAWWFLVGYFVLLLVSRWIFYDLLLNLIRGKKWDYVGHDKDQALMDRFGIPIKIISLLLVTTYLILI